MIIAQRLRVVLSGAVEAEDKVQNERQVASRKPANGATALSQRVSCLLRPPDYAVLGCRMIPLLQSKVAGMESERLEESFWGSSQATEGGAWRCLRSVLGGVDHQLLQEVRVLVRLLCPLLYVQYIVTPE